jgi:hypothetical protein
MRTPLEAVMLRLALLIVGVAFALPVSAATFTVTTTADSGPGSLRQAILDSNANDPAESDIINFNIPGAGPHVITPSSGLPFIFSRNITIDGYTQPGSSPNTRTPAQGGLDSVIRIVLSGANFGNAGDGLTFGDTSATPLPGTRTVRGIAFNRFERQIRVQFNDPFNTVALLVVEGCYFGTDAAGVAVPPLGLNGSIGVDTSIPVRIGGLLPAQRNLFAGPTGNTGNSGIGMRFTATASGVVQGNLIGTTRDGTARQGYSLGVWVQTKTSAADLLIGGTDANARNLISGNVGTGILLENFGSILVDRVVIEGNWIGTDVTGALPLPNGSVASQHAGIHRIQNFGGGSFNRIGGSAPGAANRIAFNTGRGILATGVGSAGNAGTLEIGDNEIYANAGIAFDNTDGPRANDPGDADLGTNRMQNHPEIQSALRPPGGGIAVDFRVDTAVANAAYPIRVDFYRADPSGGPLAKVGSASIAAVDAQSTRSILLTDIQGLGFLTTMATDALGNSSEYADVVDLDRILRDGFEQ